jgi:hypothetical protein
MSSVNFVMRNRIFRDRFNRIVDSNDYSCRFLWNVFPSLLHTTMVVKSPLMDPLRSERYWLRAVVLVLAEAL